MLTVNGDRDVVERQLAGGELACPSCGGVLGGWGNALERRPGFWRARSGAGPAQVTMPGVRGTHVLLPAWCMSRRADAAAVIGAALEAAAAGDGHRKIAGLLGGPAETVRGWLRRFCGRTEEVRAFFTVLLARTSPDPVMPAGRPARWRLRCRRSRAPRRRSAQRWPQLGMVPVWTAASAASGGLLLAPGWLVAGRNAS